MDESRLIRLKQRAKWRRDTAMERIRAIQLMGEAAVMDQNKVAVFSIAVKDLEAQWTTFITENAAFMEALIELNQIDELSTSVEVEIRAVYYEIINQHAELLKSSGSHRSGSRSSASSVRSEIHNDMACHEADQLNVDLNHSQLTLHHPQEPIPRNTTYTEPPYNHRARLPKLPLPMFNGTIEGWAIFKDRFLDLVGNRDIPISDKFYYLIGCVQDEAADVIKSYSVSPNNYPLAWKALVNRYDKPRLVAANLLDKIINMPVLSKESVRSLRDLLIVVEENVSMLYDMEIPDFGNFLLFVLTSRCLPISTRKLFEAQNLEEFPRAKGLIMFLKNRINVLENSGMVETGQRQIEFNKKLRKPQLKYTDNRHHMQASLVTTKQRSVNPLSCWLCTGTHLLVNCKKFIDMSANDRSSFANKKRLCYICLSDKHFSNACVNKVKCSSCNGRHHTLLHKDPSNLVDAPSQSEPSTSALLGSQWSPTVLLGTALVHIRDQWGYQQVVRVLMDSGSQVSAITSECVNRLGLNKTKWTTPVTGMSGIAVVKVEGRTKCVVSPCSKRGPEIQVDALVLPTITSQMPCVHISQDIKSKYSSLTLADPHFDKPSNIDMLLGADVFSLVVSGERVVVQDGFPVAYRSIYGWILIGRVQQENDTSVTCMLTQLGAPLEQLLHQFWQVEEPDSDGMSFTENGKCEQIFTQEHTRTKDGRHIVPLPFKEMNTTELLKDSKLLAVKRFESLEKRLQRDKRLYDAYKKFMCEYESLGHMTIAPEPGAYFIPHHAIVKSSVDDNINLRVVFDASAKTLTGYSLNNCLYTGAKLQCDIIDVLTKFRAHKFVFTADICKMYRQILVGNKYRKFQHILWRESPEQELKEYQLNTVTYGVSCAPFLAIRVLLDIANHDGASLPAVRKALCEQTYVDDICTGANTLLDVVTLQQNLVNTLSKNGLYLKKWTSNTSEVLDNVPREDRMVDDFKFGDEDGSGVKVLGLYWSPIDDSFKYKISFEELPATKRGMLSTISRLFDPLGLLGPTMFMAKHIMQNVWKSNTGWDECPPEPIMEEWKRFITDFPNLSLVSVPRLIGSSVSSAVQLCGFCDASIKGYAAVVYMRSINDRGETTIRLLGSKSKLAPVKPMSIPRLELCGMLLLARWMSRLKETLGSSFTITQLYAWSDSMVALSWLSSPHIDFKIFVSNRVAKIHVLLPHCVWSYIESKSNPADCVSRGLMPSELNVCFVYWNGPSFLAASVDQWPCQFPNTPVSDLPERKCSTTVALTATSTTDVEWFARFSDYDNAIKVVSYMRRFVIKVLKQTGAASDLPPSLDEKRSALVTLVKCSQEVTLSQLRRDLSHGRPPSSKLFARLAPFLDEDGVIRVGGRLRHSNLPRGHKNPILLSKSSHLSLLLCRHWHAIGCHAGPKFMLSMLSQRFWILAGRVVARRVLAECTTCIRWTAVPRQPYMADLPAYRVQMERPFARVGIDYAGPLLLKENQLRKSRQFKVYIAVFVCMSIKAVHLEMVSSLSTDAFLAALDRFSNRRGAPIFILSDCGTNFVGADRKLSQLVNSPQERSRILKATRAKWQFNPPSAPHFGGLFEAAVKSAKSLLLRTMGNQIFSVEEFMTVLTRVEAVLNSRPLTPMSDDPNDLACLTPGHFLIGQPILTMPEEDVSEINVPPRQRWKLLRQCHQTFWKRWSREYLHTLQLRNKWTTRQCNLAKGNMVIVKEDNAPPLLWRLGRVVETLEGKDGVVRVVKVKTEKGEITRPAAKLILLLNDEEN